MSRSPNPGSPQWSADEMLLAPYLARMVEHLVADGHDERSLLDGTGLTLEAMKKADARLPVEACLRILDRLGELGRMPVLAMRVGGELDLRSHGFLGYAVLASATLGEALDMAVRYLRTRTGLLTIRSFTEGDQAVVQFEEGVPLGERFPALIDGLVAALFRIAGQMFGVTPPPESEIRLSYPERGHHSWLREQTRGRMDFDCGFTQIRFPARWLELPVSTADPQLVQLAAEQCEKELQRFRRENELLGRVRQLTQRHVAEPRPMDAVAAALHMTPRTLRRRLAELGTTHQEIVEQLRCAMAIDRLRETSDSVEEIAASLGYNDPSNFGRAFRRWTGMSPRAWRRSRAEGSHSR